MASITGVLKGAKGKLAGFTLQKGANGNTIMRETVTPKNPNTELQQIQRAIIGTVGKAYGRMKVITDHSFEGYSNGAQCMNRFRKINANRLRGKIAVKLNNGDEMTEIYDVNKSVLTANPWIMSEGSLPIIQCYADSRRNGIETTIPVQEGNLPTYKDVCDILGLKRGDQLTIVFLSADTLAGLGFVMRYDRIILSPWLDGEAAPMSTPFLTAGTSSNTFLLNAANPRNEVSAGVTFMSNSSDALVINNSGIVVGGCIIASRKENNTWLRSYAEMKLDIQTSMIGDYLTSLYDAIHNNAGDISVENNQLYLNNATD